MVPYKGYQSLSGGKRYLPKGGGGSGVGKLATYWGIDEINKYVRNNGNQISHCGRRELQIWKGG